MLGEIDADVYVIVDGDATYDAASAPRMVDELVANDLDMVTAFAIEQGHGAAYRRGHRLGNRALNALARHAVRRATDRHAVGLPRASRAGS